MIIRRFIYILTKLWYFYFDRQLSFISIVFLHYFNVAHNVQNWDVVLV